jgi:hypothetical protein
MKIPKSIRAFLFFVVLAVPLTLVLQACVPDEDYYRQQLEQQPQRSQVDNKARLELYACVEDDNVCLYLTNDEHRLTYMDRCAVLVVKNVRGGVSFYEADLFCDADS